MYRKEEKKKKENDYFEIVEIVYCGDDDDEVGQQVSSMKRIMLDVDSYTIFFSSSFCVSKFFVGLSFFRKKMRYQTLVDHAEATRQNDKKRQETDKKTLAYMWSNALASNDAMKYMENKQ